MADAQAAEATAQRHCAFCLQLKPYKLCSGCHRRAYCSVKCQQDDWLPSGKGQRHKIWCKLEHGQEDVDWEVKPVAGKGLGIIAKRSIPSMYRIIVEGVHYEPDSHAAIADLVPEGGTLQQKFKRNSFDARNSELEPKRGYIGLRLSRLNHSCSPNSEINFCPTSHVALLCARRDIQRGEEICLSYVTFGNVHKPFKFAGTLIDSESFSVMATLVHNWGITCPADCRCTDPSVWKSISKYKHLEAEFQRCKHSDPARALNITNETIALIPTVKPPWPVQAEVHARAYHFSLNWPSTVKNSLHHLRITHKINTICQPLTAHTKNMGIVLKELETMQTALQTKLHTKLQT